MYKCEPSARMDISERRQLEVNPLSHVLQRWLTKTFIICNCIQRTAQKLISESYKGPAWKENYLFGGLNRTNQCKLNNTWVKKIYSVQEQEVKKMNTVEKIY